MERRWLVAVFYVYTVSLFSGVYPASADIPRFPTYSDYRTVVGTKANPVDDDFTDEGLSEPLKITHMRVRSEIALRYARTVIVSNVYNPSKWPQEAKFHVLLPETAFISGFTMTVGKETYDAYVKEIEEAKQIYNDAVAQGVSAAHVAAKARDSNHFTIKFNLEGKTNATYRLRYEEFLVRRNGVYNHAINLLPGALVPKMDVVVHIKESQKLSVLRVPEMRTGNEIDATEKDKQYTKVIIKRGNNEREATITFTPDLVEQKRLAEIYAEKSKQSSDPDSANIGYDSGEDTNESVGLLGQFVVQYDVDQPKNGEILVNDGYFVHFFAPKSLPPLNKHVVFVLDTSGSMEGNKISQLITAMDAILSDLKPCDQFSIIEFNSYVTVHDMDEVDRIPNFDNQNRLVKPAIASPENIAAAKIIISKFIGGGGTDIYSALSTALTLIQDVANHTDATNDTASIDDVNGKYIQEDKLEPIIIFLTDGDPTEGETNGDRIIKDLSEKNTGKKRTPIFSLAFGDDADRVFLRKLSLRNEGFMRHIYEAADAALQLHDFYRQVSSPLLADVNFVYPRRQIKEGSLSRSKFHTINDGSEVAVVGRIAEHVKEITPQVRGYSGDEKGRRKLYEVNPKALVTPEKYDHLPLERLWAYLTIKQLLDKSDAGDDRISGDGTTEDSAKQKALKIALQYSFVTPLTSLVVVKLNKTDAIDPVDVETLNDSGVLAFETRTDAFLPFIAKCAGIGCGSALTVATSDGSPVLFVQSTKHFNTDAYGGEYQGQIESGDSGHGPNIISRYPDRNDEIIYNRDSVGDDKIIYNRFPDGDDENTNWGFVSSPYEEKYNLEGFSWTSSLHRHGTETLVLQVNGTEVILRLTQHINPPKDAGGDAECTNSIPWSDKGAVEGSVCVYISRCFAARNATVDDYQHSYCLVDNGYAGICCPRSEVDKGFI